MSWVPPRIAHVVIALAIAAAAAAGCAQEEHPPLAAAEGPDASGDASTVANLSPQSGPCWQARAQPLPARLAAVASIDAGADADAGPQGTLVFVDDLVDRFSSLCGTCHGAQTGAAGNFAILNASDFTPDNGKQILTHLQSTATCPWKGDRQGPEPMPPCGSPGSGPYDKRAATDPYREFAVLVKTWLDAGSPKSFLVASNDGSSQAPTASTSTGDAPPSYLMQPGTADALTNLGNCIPSSDLALVPRPDSAKALDDVFAAAVAQPDSPEREKQLGLPSHLRDTDLVSLDAKVLAARGIFAYAPTYPLWSDDAGKLRHVRVPLGTSIRFDKATQKFDVPPNTRFYKTFMKQIADLDGSLRWKKVETRLIVARPNTSDGKGGYLLQGLFGTYRWSDDETDAVLVTTPQNNGLPFGDTLLQYTTDEAVAAAVLEGRPADPEGAVLRANAARHYAIPSAQRCIDCHRGSPNQDFVLGFTPLQVKRRATGEGGTFEPTAPDELTQLQRLIDYGVITGVDSPDDVLPLERSQGTRAPRNDYELRAQAYMLGNCAHCHNPNGQPTLENPILKDILNFLPSQVGGVFQFPLERTSPRIFRGISGTTAIPYITPSLVDQPSFEFKNVGLGSQLVGKDDSFLTAVDDSGKTLVSQAWFAPWRSLIYRNVDNAYPYTQDHAFFPHMPMNTAGYDPRVKQVVSDWMVSIPAVRKHPELPEYSFFSATSSNLTDLDAVDGSPQPYVEVPPGAPGFDAALTAAQTRLGILHGDQTPASLPQAPGSDPTTVRYLDKGHTDDILDPRIAENAFCSSDAVPLSPQDEPGIVPSHPHWVTTDITQPPGDYAPRRSDWQDALAKGGAGTPSITDRYCNKGGDPAEKVAADALATVTFTDDLTSVVRTPVPFGLWQKKPGCRYPNQKTVADVPHQHWMDQTPGILPTDPVFMQSPGGIIFNNVCINCHGPRADGTGRMAKNLLIMTGGLGRVADLYDGLFGPPGVAADKTHLHATFGAAALVPPAPSAPIASSWTSNWQRATDDDRAARYLSWMALGGTKVNIPTAILDVVGTTRFLGTARGTVDNQANPSANMLALARSLCSEVIVASVTSENKVFKARVLGSSGSDFGFFGSKITRDALILTNGDAEMWLRLCNVGHAAPVHVLKVTAVSPSEITANQQFDPVLNISQSIGAAPTGESYYPANAPVGNDRGTVDPTLTKDNLWPWCLDPITVSTTNAPLRDLVGDRASSLPICPDGFNQHLLSGDEAAAWATRGAINAGFAVYRYLSDQENKAPDLAYDQCDLLK